MLDRIKNSAIIQFILRNIVSLGLTFIGAYLLAFQFELSKLLLVISTLEGLALGLSGLALYAYTKTNFIEEKNDIVLASVFIGVHILIGLVATAFYLAQSVPFVSVN